MQQQHLPRLRRKERLRLEQAVAAGDQGWRLAIPTISLIAKKALDRRVQKWPRPASESENDSSTLEVFGPSGELLDTVELESGRAVSFRIEGDQIVADRSGVSCCPCNSQCEKHWREHVSGRAHRLQEAATSATDHTVCWCIAAEAAWTE